MFRLTPSTAFTVAPILAGKCLTTPSARSSGTRSGTLVSIRRQRPPHRHPAGRLLVGAHVHQGWIVVPATVDLELAAWIEPAAVRRLDQIGREAVDGEQAVVAVRVETRDRSQQRPGVGVLRILEDLLDGARLHDP